MKKSAHAKILDAYIRRIKVADLANIVSNVDKVWQEQNSGNAATQDRASANLHAAVCLAIFNVMDSDLENVELISERARMA